MRGTKKKESQQSKKTSTGRKSCQGEVSDSLISSLSLQGVGTYICSSLSFLSFETPTVPTWSLSCLLPRRHSLPEQYMLRYIEEMTLFDIPAKGTSDYVVPKLASASTSTASPVWGSHFSHPGWDTCPTEPCCPWDPSQEIQNQLCLLARPILEFLSSDLGGPTYSSDNGVEWGDKQMTSLL